MPRLIFDVFKAAWDVIDELLGGWPTKIAKYVTNAFMSIPRAMVRALNATIGELNNFINAANSLLGKIPGVSSSVIPTIPKIPEPSWMGNVDWEGGTEKKSKRPEKIEWGPGTIPQHLMGTEAPTNPSITMKSEDAWRQTQTYLNSLPATPASVSGGGGGTTTVINVNIDGNMYTNNDDFIRDVREAIEEGDRIFGPIQ